MRAGGQHSAVLHRRPFGLGVLKAVVALALWADVPRPAAAQPQPAILLHNVGVTVAENGGTYTQQVWLQAEPTAVVTISVVSGDPTAVTVHPTMLTFTPSNYSIRQEVTYTGVDDSILNGAHRSTTVTYTASGGNYAGVSFQDNVIAHDDEPLRFTVAEGRSYTFNLAFVVSYGCIPVVVTPSSSDPSILSTAPATLTWTEQNSGMQQSLTATFHDNNDLGNGRVTLRLPLTRPCDEGPFFQDVIFTVTDNDTGNLSVDAIPACGTTITDMSVTPSKALALDPVPSREVAAEYRVVFDGTNTWLGTRPIGPGGRSIRTSFGTFAQLRAAYAGFSGFEYRLRDHPDVTAQCTWEFDDGRPPPPPPPPPTSPTVRLSASPNPVDEGASVTVTARLSEVLNADVTIPLTLTSGTAEAGDYGSLSGITIGAGSTSGTGTISTSEDADTDDETFTVALGSLPTSVRAGNPGSVEVTINDGDGGDDRGDDGGGDDGGGDDDQPEPTIPTVRLSASPNPVDEGSSVTVTARLSEALPSNVRIPLTLTAGTAEAGDYGSLPGITIGAGSTAETGTISTSEDADTDDETFTVALGSLPSSVESGSPVSVEITIRDNTTVNQPPVFEAPTYVFKLRENEDGRLNSVALGSAVAADPDGDEVTYALVSGDGALFSVGARDGAVTYTGPGEDYETEPNRYALTIGARDPHGAEATAYVTIEVTDVSEAPSVTASCEPCVVRPGGEVRLTAEASDPDGDLMSYTWKAPAGRFMQGSLEAEARWQAPADTGRVAISVQVTDGGGGTASSEMVVMVMNAPPAFEKPSYTFELRENEDGRLNPVALGSAVAADPDGDEVTYALLSGDRAMFAVGARDGEVRYAGPGEDHEAEPNRYALTMRARDLYGAEVTVEVLVEVTNANEAPEVSTAIPDQALVEGGAAAEFDLGPYFEDPDGDPLSYAASSSDTSVAAVSVAGSVFTLTLVAYGAATIEVTARDPGGLSARQTFAIVVDDRLVRTVLDVTLAALARAHLASARMTLGRRVGPDGAPVRSMLTVRGVSIPLDMGMARETAGRLFHDTVRSGRLARLAGGAGNTAFMFGWGGDDGAMEAAGRRTWRLWGQGDVQTFEGAQAPERGYEGDLRSGWVGLDRALGERWLAGVAVARSRGGGDWRAGTASGRLETSLTATYPYLRWSDAATSVWTMAGGGRGTAENARATGRVGETDLTLGLGFLEVRRRIAGWFGLRADGGWVRLSTADGTETVDGHLATVDQQRLGIELNPASRHLGLALDASVRRDGGAGQAGTGMELAGGIRVAGGPFRIDAQGRILVLHSAQDYRERGLGVSITVGSPAGEGGLSLVVSSRWGGPAAGTGELWKARNFGLRKNSSVAPWSLDARVHWMPRSPARISSAGFRRTRGVQRAPSPGGLLDAGR